jgi:hypothetical protein
MTAPGFVPRPDVSLVDRIAKIETRLRVMQQAAAGATTAGGGAPLSNLPPSAIGPAPVTGTGTSSAHTDHVHTSALAAQQDVTVTAPAAGHQLTYTGTGWGNVPVAVSATSAITAPYTGQIVYNTTDGLLYRYTAGSWVAVCALGPDNQVTPSATQVHEARYRAATTANQALAAGNNAVQFASADYSSNDVSVSGTGNSVFTLQRAGLWIIDIAGRIADSTAAIGRFLQLTDSTFATIYKAASVPVASGTPTVDIVLTCVMRFAVSTALSVNAVSSATGAIDRATASNAARTSISLAWLRP